LEESLQLEDSSAVVGVVTVLIGHAEKIFQMDAAMLEEVQKLAAAPGKN
jgi:hypothetical protein